MNDHKKIVRSQYSDMMTPQLPSFAILRSVCQIYDNFYRSKMLIIDLTTYNLMQFRENPPEATKSRPASGMFELTNNQITDNGSLFDQRWIILTKTNADADELHYPLLHWTAMEPIHINA